jgi:hypothetical protein
MPLYTTLQCNKPSSYLAFINVAVNPFSLMMEAVRTAAHQDAANQQAGKKTACTCASLDSVARHHSCWEFASVYIIMCSCVSAE